MTPEGGSLRLRGSTEPFFLEAPTTLSGTVDTGPGGTGALTGVSFATPEVSFQRPVLGGALTADVDARFSEVVPGAATGSVTYDGNVAVTLALRVDLHIDVENGSIVGDCVTSPVNLNLQSTAPYDPATQRVTLAVGNFTVPAIQPTPTCAELVADGVNEALAGSGHALTLIMEGAIELPQEPGDPTTTTLSASPSGTTRFGEPVTLTADVAPVDGSTPEVPGGFVEFRDGATVLEIVELTNGQAQLVTEAIGFGARSLTAHYRGDPNFAPSTSSGLAYTVTANPAIDVDLPSTVILGAEPVPFDLTVENPAAGEAIENARVDMSIFNRLGVNNIDPRSVLLEVGDGAGTWTPVTFAPDDDPETALVPDRLVGSLGPVTGAALSPGETLVVPLRLSFPAAPPSGAIPARLARVDVRFDLVTVDPETGEGADTVVSTPGSFSLVGPDRVATTVVAGSSFNPPVSPPVVRHGNTVYVTGLNVTPIVGDPPTGSYSFEVDGQPVLASVTFNNGLDLEPASTVPIVFNGGRVNGVTIRLPLWVGVGSHQMVVKYSGDHLYQPSFRAEAFTVVPSSGTLYECSASTLLQAYRLTLQVTAQADVPRSVRSGTEVVLGRFDVALRADRGAETFNLFNQVLGSGPAVVGGDRLKAFEFGIGPDGEGTVASAQFSGTRMRASELSNPPVNPDLLVTFAEESGGLTVEGEPGDVVPVTLDRFRFQSATDTSTIDFECTPAGAPVSFGEVTVAGTRLDVAAPAVTRVGDPVTLNALVAPATAAGVVEFLDGEDIVGLATPVNGQASVTVALDEGVHQLRARFRTGASAPSSVSEAVQLEVLPEHACSGFTDAGSGRVVRLVYLELLGRCPDQAGYDHWVDRLDGGTSREAFARSIARTPEAVGRVVDDAYRTMLGRSADSSGRAFWVRRLQGHGRYDQLLADLAASPEFWSKAGSSNDGFVTRIYESLLTRSPDQSGLDHWVGRLQAGESQRRLVLALANLNEPLGALVGEAYDEILDRRPGVGELADGIAFLRRTGDRSGLYAQLIGTEAFDTRAQSLPNPED